MSNIYNLEPPTSGKVIIITSSGEIEVELWSKECPKACRNFIQLCLEGYYDKTTFHRVVPGFIIQGGDPTATGSGGESIYGEPFEDEFHSRLRFNRRGLLGMANAGINDNGSQFFFTLDKTEELQNKNTLFGKIEGATFFNVLKISESELGGPDNDRPVYPTKIIATRVIINPFDDLVPRAQLVPTGSQPPQPLKPTKKKKKNLALLSFGEEVDEDQGSGGGIKSSHDLLTNDRTLSKKTAPINPVSTNSKVSHLKESVQKSKPNSPVEEKPLVSPKKEVVKANSSQDEIARLQKEIRDLKRPKAEREESTPPPARSSEHIGKAFLLAQKEKYATKSKKKKSGSRIDSNETMAKFMAFQSKLQSTAPSAVQPKLEDKGLPCTLHLIPGCQSCKAHELTTDLHTEEGDPESWLTHSLQFPQERNLGGDRLDDYDVIDPRQKAPKTRLETKRQTESTKSRDNISSIQRFK